MPWTSVDGFSSTVEMTDDRVSELKNQVIETIQLEEQKRKDFL